jgi:hypothetical protein
VDRTETPGICFEFRPWNFVLGISFFIRGFEVSTLRTSSLPVSALNSPHDVQKLILILIFVLAGLTFFTGINWGLPSRANDAFLFGDRTPWTGRQIMELAGAWDDSAGRGADIAMHPLLDRRQLVDLNDTDAERAEIVRRYRLYSNQPDEMITFRSLSSMKPGRFMLDPKMYQYGGLWIYPVGGLLKISAMLHIVTLRTDLAFYLDHPEEFAKFYVVARCYSAAWGLLGVWVVHLLGKEWTGKALAGLTAAALFASMPVVIDLAHEAKPHLAGTVLILLAMLFALRFVRTGLRKWWLLAGISTGAAMGMVLTGYVAFAVIPTMVLLRTMPMKNRVQIMLAAGLVGFGIFAITNPYLLINLLFHRQMLHSNVGNYGTFYKPAFTVSGWMITARGLLEGLSIPVAAAGGIGLLSLWSVLRRKNLNRGDAETWRGNDWMQLVAPVMVAPVVIAPVALVILQMVLLGQGKTAEYGRFGLLADVVVAIFAGALVGELQFKPREKGFVAFLLVAGTLYFGVRYDVNFVLDNRVESTRHIAAETIASCSQRSDQLAVWAEPAPYCLPPVDLFTWHISLLPTGTAVTDIPAGAIAVRTVDEPESLPAGIKRFTPVVEQPRPLSPISWANKPIEVLASTRLPVSRPAARP